jgi:hypothetical protein
MSIKRERLETVLEELTPEENQTILRFAEFLLERHRVPVDARTARRKVSAWLVRDVGSLLMGGEPEYVPGEHPVWQVPVIAPYGRQERAMFVDVNAHTGELLVADDTPQKILANVQSFVADSASN